MKPSYSSPLLAGRDASPLTKGNLQSWVQNALQPPPMADYPVQNISAYQNMFRRDQPGMLEAGNIDLSSRPVLVNPDGSSSTVYSYGFDLDGGEHIVLPGIAHDGSRLLSSKEALGQYRATGKHLGIFNSREAADNFANALHQQQAQQGTKGTK